MPKSDDLDLRGYKLTFSDEFNRFSSNGPSNYQDRSHTGTWDTTYAYGERKLNDEVQIYSDSTIGIDPFSVADGVLNIHAAPSVDSLDMAYTSGAITTNHSFSQRYGYFEMRAKLPQGAGMWPAFWLLPQVHMWPPEIDALEGFGAPGPGGDGGAYSFHYGRVAAADGGQGAWQDTGGANLYTQYNRFGVDWQADWMTFYFNGKAYASMATPGGFDQPMYLLANLAVGGNWAGAPLGQSADLKIDYIRAFSKDGASPAVAQEAILPPDGRGYDFYGATDANGYGALGGSDLPPLPPTVEPPPLPAPAGDQVVGNGRHDLLLRMSGDAYQGDAQFIVTVDGVQVGGVLSVAASHSKGDSQAFHVLGNYTPGVHWVGINFLNNFGGAPGSDRNLFLDGASLDGTPIAGASFAAYIGGERLFAFFEGDIAAVQASIPVVIIGSGDDTVILLVSEDEWRGDAQFTVAVDGVQVGGVQVATASHVAGLHQRFEIRGAFGPGAHRVDVNFLNDRWDGSDRFDRNLYVDGASYRGSVASLVRLDMLRGGVRSFVVGNASVPVALDPAALGSGRTNIIGNTSGDDRLTGTSGHDTVDLSNRSIRGSVFTANGTETVHRHAGQVDTYRNIEELRFLDGRMVLDPTDSAAQVMRLYQAALDRVPDQEGLNFWIRHLERGGTLGEVIEAFSHSPEFATHFSTSEDGSYVDRLYQNVLGRPGDAGGKAFWLDTLKVASRQDVLASFSESGENKASTQGIVASGIWDRSETAAQVARLYGAALGRLPDASGLAFWRGKLDDGSASMEDVADAFSRSTEFTSRYGALGNSDFVEELYRNTLGRTGDEVGAGYWTGQLDVRAQSRMSVITGFSESTEHVARTAPQFASDDPAQYGITLGR